MKSRSHLHPFYRLLALTLVLFTFGIAQVKAEVNTQSYEQLTEKYLQHVAQFEWEASFEMLADDVQFKLPNGDSDSRTVFSGIDEVKAFWKNYVRKSGNDKALFKDFVHIPVQGNVLMENMGTSGVTHLCYFSAELNYGSQKANVRMHWALHFNDRKEIDGIHSYYDRTPIIEAANQNFMASTGKINKTSNDMVIQIIKVNSQLAEEELIQTATERAASFRLLPGLTQKYYVRTGEPGVYAGLYIWESAEAMKAFQKTDLAATIKDAYKLTGAPEVEISEVLFQLRED